MNTFLQDKGMLWWSTMVFISTVNLVIAWVLGLRNLQQDNQHPSQRRFLWCVEVLGIIFVSVAFYRTIFVSSYPNLLAWFDTILNSPLIIRSLAFCAEMSFIGIISAILLQMNGRFPLLDRHGKRSIPYVILEKMPYLAVGCIFTAQFFAFGGLLAQNNLLFAIEETLWAIAFISITPLIIVRLLRSTDLPPTAKKYKTFLVLMALWCGGYLAFQCFYALPFMHYANLTGWPHDIVLADAFHQAFFGYTATQDFTTWGGIGFFVWHSGYFSICSWLVLYFMTVPNQENQNR